MKTENANSARTSGTTSTPAPKTAGDASKMSEADFLAQQAAEAKAAMSRAMAQLKVDLGETVNVAAWTRQYPWISLGTVAVAGFLATSALIPSKEQQALKRLRAIERALTPSSPASTSSDTNGNGKPAQKPSIFQKMAQEAIKALPGVLSAVATTLTAKVNDPQSGPSQSGGDPYGGRYPSNPS
jgi:hypothetical protein